MQILVSTVWANATLQPIAVGRGNEIQTIKQFPGMHSLGILYPRDPEMRGRINRMVKKREEFRPFGPAVTAETAAQYLDILEADESTYAHM
jgi:predicted NodU family carbamoyl transferase